MISPRNCSPCRFASSAARAIYRRKVSAERAALCRTRRWRSAGIDFTDLEADSVFGLTGRGCRALPILGRGRCFGRKKPRCRCWRLARPDPQSGVPSLCISGGHQRLNTGIESDCVNDLSGPDHSARALRQTLPSWPSASLRDDDVDAPHRAACRALPHGVDLMNHLRASVVALRATNLTGIAERK